MRVEEDSALNQAMEFPFAHTKAFCSLFGAEEAMLGRRRKTHMQLGYDLMLDSSACVDVESICNATFLLIVTI